MRKAVTWGAAEVCEYETLGTWSGRRDRGWWDSYDTIFEMANHVADVSVDFAGDLL